MQPCTKEGSVFECVAFLRSLSYSVSKEGPVLKTEPHSSLCDGLIGVYSFGWHIFGLFVIFLSSLIGILLPLITERITYLKNHPYAFAFTKTMSTGVLLSVSTIHLINEGAIAFLAPCVEERFSGYPAYAFLLALIATLLMQALDIELSAIVEKWMRRNQFARAQESYVTLSSPCDESLHQIIPNPCLPHPLKKYSRDSRDIKTPEPMSTETLSASNGALSISEATIIMVIAIFFEAPEGVGLARKVISAICMELGVAFHSIFIGITVGLTTDTELSPLLIALFFHQMFEGIALGSRLKDANFHGVLKVSLIAVFTLSAPFGMLLSIIAVGISRDAMSGPTFITTMAVMDSLCGGILLYLAFNLLLFDFPSDLRIFCADEIPSRVRRKVGLFFALWFGMALLAFVGKWL